MLRRRRLGRTSLQVSEIALGTVELGLDYGIPSGDHVRPNEAAAARLLHRALDLGINLIDTARAYGDSEAIIGQALHDRRDEIILASKVVCPPPGTLDDAQLRNEIAGSVATSLRFLQTDMLDLLYIHSAGIDLLRAGQVAAILEDLRRDGLVRYLGASTYGEEAGLLAIADGRFDCIQVAMNALDRAGCDRLVPAAVERGVGVVVRSVLLKGALTERCAFLPVELAPLRAAIKQLAELASQAGISLPELAYRFVLAQPGVATALVGTARITELEQVYAYAAQPPLTPDLLSAIEQVHVEQAGQLNPTTWPI